MKVLDLKSCFNALYNDWKSDSSDESRTCTSLRAYIIVMYRICSIRRRSRIVAAPPDVLNETVAALEY